MSKYLQLLRRYASSERSFTIYSEFPGSNHTTIDLLGWYRNDFGLGR